MLKTKNMDISILFKTNMCIYLFDRLALVNNLILEAPMAVYA